MAKERPEDLAARDVFLHLVRAHEKLSADFAALFKEHGLTRAQYNVLRILVGGPKEGAACQYVGERLITREPDVTRLIDRMQAAGLVERARSESDRRVVLTRITAKGRKLVERLAEPVMTLHRRQLAPLSARETAALGRSLEKLLQES